MALVLGTAGLSMIILVVALSGTQSIAEATRYQMFEWEEEPDRHSDDSGDPDAAEEDPAPASDDGGPLSDILEPGVDPAPPTEPVAVALHLGEVSGTLTVQADGSHRLEVPEGLSEEAAQDRLQQWADTRGLAPFSFTGWQALEPIEE